MNAYQRSIKTIIGDSKYSPRHIEAWMRSEHGTLDRLSKAAFRSEVSIALSCIDEAGVEQSEQLAKSYGL